MSGTCLINVADPSCTIKSPVILRHGPLAWVSLVIFKPWREEGTREIRRKREGQERAREIEREEDTGGKGKEWYLLW